MRLIRRVSGLAVPAGQYKRRCDRVVQCRHQRLWCIRATLILLSLTAVRGHAQSDQHERTIRQRRASSNAAIAKHDTAGIGAVLADDVVVVTSNSVHGVGRAINLQRFADQFRTRADVVYERTPEQVRVYGPWGMASELGRWTGSWTDADGKIQIGGIYFAKWRLKNGSWLIESETYVPEKCVGGSYCRTPP